MNKVILIGRLCQDTQLQRANELAYTRNTIAVQRSFKNANGEYDTDFINFTAYRLTAELIVNHFKKGDRIGLIGEWRTNKYQDQSGQTRVSNELVVNEIEFLQEKREQEPPLPQTYDTKPSFNNNV